MSTTVMISCYKTTNKCVEEVAIFVLMHFWILPQHVSESHCHHQGVVVSSEANQAVCIVDVYGLRPIQSDQLSRDVTKCVMQKCINKNIATSLTHFLVVL
jgi:hypothetical protein